MFPISAIIVLLSLISIFISTVKSAEYVAEPLVHIDGYTPEGTLDIGDTVQLGTTVILVCTVTGIPYGVQTSYRWTCPNGPCSIGKGRNPNRKTYNDTLVINVISSNDEGEYTCEVTTGINDINTTYRLQVEGGHFLSSNNNLILPNSLITDTQDIGGDEGPLMINCTKFSRSTHLQLHFVEGLSKWIYECRCPCMNQDIQMSTVHQIRCNNYTTIVIRDKVNFNNSKYYCALDSVNLHLYLYIKSTTTSEGPSPSNLTVTSNQNLLRVHLSNIASLLAGRKAGYIVKYERLDMKVTVELNYQRYDKRGKLFSDSNKNSTAVPGAKYRIQAWIIEGSNIRSAPYTMEYKAPEKVPTKPRHLTITRVCKDGVELNWMPPREPNGELHYIIQYGSNTINTTRNLTYYNLTGLVNDTTYNITVMAVNSAGNNNSDVMEYMHFSSNVSCNNSDDLNEILISAISGAAGAVILLMIIIITVVVLILCVSTRRKRNNTGKTPHYTTTTHTRNTSSGGPTGDYDDEPQVKAAQQHTAHTTTSFSVYDDIDSKPDKRNDIEQFADPMYEDVDMKKGKEKKASKNGKGDDVPSIDPSDLYTMPNKIKKKKSKKLQEVDNSDQLYAQPDKTKKKGKKETSEEQEKEDVLQYEPSADSEEDEVPPVPSLDTETHYSAVNK